MTGKLGNIYDENKRYVCSGKDLLWVLRIALVGTTGVFHFDWYIWLLAKLKDKLIYGLNKKKRFPLWIADLEWDQKDLNIHLLYPQTDVQGYETSSYVIILWTKFWSLYSRRVDFGLFTFIMVQSLQIRGYQFINLVSEGVSSKS